MSINLALVLEKAQESFVVKETTKWTPAPGEVLVKVLAVGLNPVDWKVQRGYLPIQYPVVLGWDIAGDVEEVGEGVTGFQKGDRVLTEGDFMGGASKAGYQQYATTYASALTKIPANLSYDDAASFPVGIVSVYVGLYNVVPFGLGLDRPGAQPDPNSKYSGTPFLVIGGSSTVGQAAIQFAKLSGFYPIIATASTKHAAALRELGADHVLSRTLSTAELREEIAKITSKPLTYVLDSIAEPEIQQTADDLLAPNGYRASAHTNSVKDVAPGKTVVEFRAMLRFPENTELLNDLFQNRLYGWLEKGYFKPLETEVLPNGLHGISDGLARLEKNQVSKLKLVAHPHETRNS